MSPDFDELRPTGADMRAAFDMEISEARLDGEEEVAKALLAALPRFRRLLGEVLLAELREMPLPERKAYPKPAHVYHQMPLSVAHEALLLREMERLAREARGEDDPSNTATLQPEPPPDKPHFTPRNRLTGL